MSFGTGPILPRGVTGLKPRPGGLPRRLHADLRPVRIRSAWKVASAALFKWPACPSASWTSRTAWTARTARASRRGLGPNAMAPDRELRSGLWGHVLWTAYPTEPWWRPRSAGPDMPTGRLRRAGRRGESRMMRTPDPDRIRNSRTRLPRWRTMTRPPPIPTTRRTGSVMPPRSIRTVRVGHKPPVWAVRRHWPRIRASNAAALPDRYGLALTRNPGASAAG
jgi:hypothetical protein